MPSQPEAFLNPSFSTAYNDVDREFVAFPNVCMFDQASRIRESTFGRTSKAVLNLSFATIRRIWRSSMARHGQRFEHDLSCGEQL